MQPFFPPVLYTRYTLKALCYENIREAEKILNEVYFKLMGKPSGVIPW